MKLRNKKTGEIIELYYITLNEYVITLHTNNPKTAEYCYSKLLSIYEEWEDYNPKEPLIKDDKIRKAVRAWAEANGVKEIIIFDHSNNAPYTPVGAVDFAQNCGHLKIRFRTEERFDTDRIYTVDELCGEEKPRQ